MDEPSAQAGARPRAVVFFGSASFGLPTLRYLHEHHRLLGVVSQPDRPAGRGKRPTPTPVSQWVMDHAPEAPLIQPGDVNEPGVVERIRRLDDDAPDDMPRAWVVVAFGQKLGRPLLEGRFVFNVHGSLLPRWRGASPIQSAMLAGDAEVGNCLIEIADRMDAGGVYDSMPMPLDPSWTFGEVYDRLSADAPLLVDRLLSRQDGGPVRAGAQDESRVTRARKLSKADGWVDFAESASACRRRIHALNPWPGVTVAFRGEGVKLLRADVRDDAPPPPQPWEPGRVLDAGAGLIQCGDGTVLRVIEVHPAGGRAMTWQDFARGRRVEPGEVLMGGRPAC